MSVAGTSPVKSLGPSNDDDVGADLAVAEAIAGHRGLSERESLYLYDGGAISIETGTEDGAYAWDTSRPLAEQLVGPAADDAAADGLAVELLRELDDGIAAADAIGVDEIHEPDGAL